MFRTLLSWFQVVATPFQHLLEAFYHWQESSRKEIILGCNKKLAILALNYILKNSKEIILVSGIKRRGRNNNIKEE